MCFYWSRPSMLGKVDRQRQIITCIPSFEFRQENRFEKADFNFHRSDRITYHRI